jgi:hypothetical protein
VTNRRKGWLATARITDDPEGDLIADMQGDPAIPPFFGSPMRCAVTSVRRADAPRR